MKRLFLILFSLYVFNVNAASTSELLVQSINENSERYLCNFTELKGEKYKEIVVCVEGKDLKSIELINFWFSNFNGESHTQKEYEKLVEKAEHLIPISSYVLSVKTLSDSNAENSFVYMTAFCSHCQSINSASALDDQSSFVFDSLKVLSHVD
ncbi:hypothetical protein [Vibrio navarrensis]|uniref:hypothetical protein n=1 Tax=Vibrio navarrensis TaxID=29495 RepID=UPI0029BFB58D|nr:hypothetical protein [Vibrio navarrensis]